MAIFPKAVGLSRESLPDINKYIVCIEINKYKGVIGHIRYKASPREINPIIKLLHTSDTKYLKKYITPL